MQKMWSQSDCWIYANCKLRSTCYWWEYNWRGYRTQYRQSNDPRFAYLVETGNLANFIGHFGSHRNDAPPFNSLDVRMDFCDVPLLSKMRGQEMVISLYGRIRFMTKPTRLNNLLPNKALHRNFTTLRFVKSDELVVRQN